MAERLARRASLKHPKATADVISAHMEVAAFYGVSFKGYEQGYAKEGAVQLCYNGEAFRRVLALPASADTTLRLPPQMVPLSVFGSEFVKILGKF